VLLFYVLCHPINKVVLECPLDELVQDIGGDKFVDACMREIFRE